MPADQIAIQVAERLTRAFETLDAEAFEALYTADATVWHSFDQVEQDRAAAMTGVRRFFAGLAALRIDGLKRLATAEGFVQQHLLSGTFAAGGGFSALPVCLVVRTDGDRIARIDEYIDPKALRP